MRSFVKPSTNRIGLAAASSIALVAAPTVALPAYADSFSVTNCNSAGAGSFAQALSESNSTPGPNTINFDTSSDCTVTVVDTMFVDESVTIQNYSGYEFTLQNDATNDGPILMTNALASTTEYIDLYIDGITFDGNDVNTGSPILLFNNAYYLVNAVIRNSEFMNAELSAIVTFEQQQLKIYDTYFHHNSGSRGGAISNYSTATLIKDSTFYANSAVNGGAISSVVSDLDRSGNVVVVDSTFTRNSAGMGGAIYVGGGEENLGYYGYLSYANLEVRGSSFTENHADSVGGAISSNDASVLLLGAFPYVGYDDDYGLVFSDPESTRFVGNDSSYGGAISSLSGRLISVASYFGDNSSTLGGAIWSYGELGDGETDPVLITYLDHFEGNEATSYGGAILAAGNKRVLIGFDALTNNVAGYGSAIFAASNYSAQFVANNIAYNSSGVGAAVVLQGASVIESDNDTLVNALGGNTFMQNSADAGGYGASFAIVDSEDESVSVFSNIFASDDPLEPQLTLLSPQLDLGANLVTGPSAEISAGVPLPTYPGIVEGQSALVTWEALDLQAPALNDSNPDNASIWPSIALGPDSIAIDYFNIDSPGLNLPEDPSFMIVSIMSYDSRFVRRINSEGIAVHGSGIDVGAFEYGATREPSPVLPNIAITDVSKSSISATGDTFSIYGRGLDDVTELYIGGVKVSFVVVSATELRVTSGALPLGTQEILAIATDGRASFQLGVGVVEEPSYWTKNLGNGQAKIYAKNIVGEGKVQFFLNGKEIAWINAIDETDPKLRKANGAAYLVRTVNLTAGKNRLEVKVDGVRVRFTTYKL